MQASVDMMSRQFAHYAATVPIKEASNIQSLADARCQAAAEAFQEKPIMFGYNQETKEAFLKDLQYPTVLNEYLRLKEKWHVSIAMMIRRAYMLEVLSPSQYQYLFRQLGSRGWRTFEPGDMVEVPTASLFSVSVKILDDNGIIEKGNLLKYLNENCFTAQQKTFEDLMGLEQHTLDPAMSGSFSRVEFKPN